MPGFWLASLWGGGCALCWAKAVWKDNCLELWWQRLQVQFQGRVGGQTALCSTNQLRGEQPIKGHLLMETVTCSGGLVVYEMTA